MPHGIISLILPLIQAFQLLKIGNSMILALIQATPFNINGASMGFWCQQTMRLPIT